MESFWKKPDSVELDSDGKMFVWYPDGTDEIDKTIKKNLDSDFKIDNNILN